MGYKASLWYFHNDPQFYNTSYNSIKWGKLRWSLKHLLFLKIWVNPGTIFNEMIADVQKVFVVEDEWDGSVSSNKT